MLLFGWFHFDHRKNIFFQKVYYVLVFCVMTGMVALRYRVGGDTLMYMTYYRYLPDFNNLLHFFKSGNIFGYQPGYLLFTGLCKLFSKDYGLYQIVHAVVVNTVIFWFIWVNTRFRYTVLLILYVFLLYFYFTFEIQREVLGVCCFLLAYSSLESKKWLKYYLLATLAFLFHISAIILFIIPFFNYIKLNRKTTILLLLFSFPLLFLKEPLFKLFEIFFFTEAMSSKGEQYYEMNFSIVGLLAFYFARVITLLPFLFLFNKEVNSKHWILTPILILLISSQIMVGFDRFLNYIYIPYIIFAVNYFSNSQTQVHFSSLRIKIAALSFALNLFFVLAYKVVLDSGVTHRARYHSVFFPYESIFDKKKTQERERFMYELWRRKE